MLAGRPGVRVFTTEFWKEFRQLVTTAWSRTNLERRGKVGVAWTGAHVIVPFLIYANQITQLIWLPEKKKPRPDSYLYISDDPYIYSH